MLPSNFEKLLKGLDGSPLLGALPITTLYLEELEATAQLQLPDDYRAFLLQTGGSFLNGVAKIAEAGPTPIGANVVIDSLFGHSSKNSYDLKFQNPEPANETLHIGGNLMGMPFYMICAGPEAGFIFCCDTQQRHLWPDDRFQTMFPNLAPEIREWIQKRKDGKLKPNRAPYYLLSRSFSEFIQGLSLERMIGARPSHNSR